MNIGSREIVLWLSEPQHQALTRALGEMGTDIETIMQARLEELYSRTVPVTEPGDGGRAFGTAAAVGGKPDFLSVPDYGAWTGQLPDEGRLRRVSGCGYIVASVSAPAE